MTQSTKLAACADLFDHAAHAWKLADETSPLLCPGVGANTATAGPVPTADEVARFMNGAVSDEEFLNGKMVPIVTPVTPPLKWACECPWTDCSNEYPTWQWVADHLQRDHRRPMSEVKQWAKEFGVEWGPMPVFDKDPDSLGDSLRWECPAECGIICATSADLIDHLRGFHGWSQSDINEFKELTGLNKIPLSNIDALDIEFEPCDHPNGFGPNGCAGCGDSRPTFELWWAKLVRENAPTIQRKAEEYGTNSLMEMGRLFARANGRPVIDDVEAVQLGCFVYAFGKVQRVMDAMLKGVLPSEDTVKDTMIYMAMSMYAREFKAWP